MHKGYVSGLVTGAVVGGLLAIWLAPQVSGASGEHWMAESRRLGRRAQDWWQRGRDAAGDWVDHF